MLAAPIHRRALLGLVAFLMVLVVALPPFARAAVLLGNPGKLSITLPGAASGEVVIDAWTYHPLSGTPEVEYDVSGDVVAGIDYSCTLSSLYGITLEPRDGEIIITGSNAWGEYEVAIAESELDFDGDDLPKALAYTVISGVVTTAPILDVD